MLSTSSLKAKPFSDDSKRINQSQATSENAGYEMEAKVYNLLESEPGKRAPSLHRSMFLGQRHLLRV